jgi:hypothetical protein
MNKPVNMNSKACICCENRNEPFHSHQPAKLTLSLLIDIADTLTEEDHGTTGTTERLMGGGHDKVSVFEWRWKNTSSNETLMREK